MASASTAQGRPFRLFFAVAALTAVLDQVTKALALAHLQTGPVHLLGGAIRLTLTRNTGSAFGLPVPPWLATAIALAVCMVVLAWIGRARSGARRALALGLLFGGALGNLVDRLRLGAVVDFIDLGVWPVFNVADVALTIGLALLMVEAVRGRQHRER